MTTLFPFDDHFRVVESPEGPRRAALGVQRGRGQAPQAEGEEGSRGEATEVY